MNIIPLEEATNKTESEEETSGLSEAFLTEEELLDEDMSVEDKQSLKEEQIFFKQ